MSCPPLRAHWSNGQVIKTRTARVYIFQDSRIAADAGNLFPLGINDYLNVPQVL